MTLYVYSGDSNYFLSLPQILCLITADPVSGFLYSHLPDWVVIECVSYGLVTRGDELGAWRLTEAGTSILERLLAD